MITHLHLNYKFAKTFQTKIPPQKLPYLILKSLNIVYATIYLNWFANYSTIINTVVTPGPRPSSITACVTQTSHVITYHTVSTVSYTLLSTVYSKPAFFAFYKYKKPNYFMKRLQFIFIYLVLSFTFLRVLIDLITCVDLTWNTCFTNPPRNTSKTGSKMYVTIFVFTAYRTGDATVTAIHARALTTF